LNDPDDDNDDTPDGDDPDEGTNPQVPGPNGDCTVDGNAPVINAADITIDRCLLEPLLENLPVSVTDDSCPDPEQVDFEGRIVSVNGTILAEEIIIDGHDPEVTLPIGETVIEWTAEDVNYNTSTVTQTVTVSDSTDSTVCCAPGQTVVVGDFLPNFYLLTLPQQYCVFGRGSYDTITTGIGADFLSGGTGNDNLNAGFAGDVAVGGPGNDTIELAVSGATGYGGSGDDYIEITGDGKAYGNAGDDTIFTLFGDHDIYPGPGRDDVEAGSGTDRVYILDECEVEAFEALDGGLGYDILYTSLTLSELYARGVLVFGFEEIVVTNENAHLSECY
jgi:Ca2+-binding RTX toxin-like protein